MTGRWFVCLIILLAQVGCRAVPPRPITPRDDVVIWISVDGLRHDYIDRDRVRLPLFNRLMRQGVYTRQLVPVFPTLTFPSHASEATGVTVDRHGIVSNSFYDENTRQRYSFPTTAAIMQAEPIWITAPRQGVRTAVFDWPLSYQQAGPVHSDYFAEKYVSKEHASDRDRLAVLLDIWRRDDPAAHGGRPLRLIMGYIPIVDDLGHKHGPDAPEVRAAVVDVDRMLGEFLAQAEEIFRLKSHGGGDRLYVVITTDHGMSPVHTQVNAERLLGDAYSNSLKILTSGNVANIYLDDLPTDRRDAVRTRILSRLREHQYLQAWAKEDLPGQWHYAHASRTGDVVATLAVGYTWTSKRDAVSKPVPSSGPLGMHGYAVETDRDMLGFALIACVNHPLGGRDLGEVDSLRLHPTVARMLGIDPAPNANAPPLGFGR